MSLPPSEVPQGAIRFNTDSQKLEFYAQGEWWVMSTDTPNLGRSVDTTPGARGMFCGGLTPGRKNELDYINISSTGNAIDFGNLSVSRGGGGTAGDRSRGLLMGGYSVPGYSDTIDFWTFASTGDATDFGNLSATRGFCQATSNSTRAINGGGWNPASDVLDYVTIQSTGNAVDFGNLSLAREIDCASGSPTRGIWAGGISPGSPASPSHNIIEFVTIATTGNSQDFGDLAIASWGGSGSGNATRMIMFGGQNASGDLAYDGTISSITIASGGNAVKFGDMIDTTAQGRGGCSNSTRAVSGGHNEPLSTEIEYVEIATEGNSVDFGDLTVARFYATGVSNAHGGL